MKPPIIVPSNPELTTANQPPLTQVEPPLIPKSPQMPLDRPTKMTLRRKFCITCISGLCVMLLLSVGIYVIRAYSSPQRSIITLLKAIERRDQETVAQHIDAPALAASLRKYVVEAVRMEASEESTGDSFDSFIKSMSNLIGEQIVASFAEAVVTPESTLAMMSGESPADALKKSMGNFADKSIDALTLNSDFKTQTCAFAGKLAVRLAAAYIIDEAAADVAHQQSEVNPADYDISADYENLNRYLIRITNRTSTSPGVGYVFKRHGLMTWKLSEIRLLPRSTQQIKQVAEVR